MLKNKKSETEEYTDSYDEDDDDSGDDVIEIRIASNFDNKTTE
jgi:hypothetical protein